MDTLERVNQNPHHGAVHIFHTRKIHGNGLLSLLYRLLKTCADGRHPPVRGKTLLIRCDDYYPACDPDGGRHGSTPSCGTDKGLFGADNHST
jgi:hypothetical protein